MLTYTKDSLIDALKDIAARGWIPNTRPGNDGGVGNTLEDLLGITENNLPIPNAAEWELKCQRQGTTSLITLMHIEPSPKALKIVPQILLPNYGWPHGEAGIKYPGSELSFRQTINARTRSDRGFGIRVNRIDTRVEVSFCAAAVASRHADWLSSVEARIGLAELCPQPYWGFDDLFHHAGTKLHNCFYVVAACKKEYGTEFYRYMRVLMLQSFDLDKWISAIEQGHVYFDFDARTGHNHGTKVRIRQALLPSLYATVTSIV